MKDKVIKTNSEKQTIGLAEQFARQIKSECILGLIGELGAGKTCFVKGLARGFGIKQPITSPTFVLLKEYPVNTKQKSINKQQGNTKTQITKFVHIDCYRLSNPEELLELGLEEYIKNNSAVTAIEWADKIKKVLPKSTIWVKFKLIDKLSRKIILSA